MDPRTVTAVDQKQKVDVDLLQKVDVDLLHPTDCGVVWVHPHMVAALPHLPLLAHLLKPCPHPPLGVSTSSDHSV